MIFGYLSIGEVGVVRGVNPVVSQRPGHVLVNHKLLRLEETVTLTQQEATEFLKIPHQLFTLLWLVLRDTEQVRFTFCFLNCLQVFT